MRSVFRRIIIIYLLHVHRGRIKASLSLALFTQRRWPLLHNLDLLLSVKLSITRRVNGLNSFLLPHFISAMRC